LSSLVHELRDAIVHVEALLAYDVDFPEEDDGPVPRRRISEAARVVEARLATLIATAPLGDVARDGAVVVLAGVPNAGKSSLFNALVGEERAIVTEVAGTTRDAIEARVERRPWPLRLVDTAGLRPTDDRLERLGIEVSERHIDAAHLVILCGETDDDLEAAHVHVRGRTMHPVLRVQTKGDRSTAPAATSEVKVSAQTREGLGQLLRLVDEHLALRLGVVPVDGAVITRARQRTALEKARAELLAFIDVWEANTLPGAIAAIHVQSAAAALDELIGTVDVEDVLDRVFRTFCVGK
jgi:tRNA modification GTPase